MSLLFYDPQPFKNDYVSLKFIGPMREYARNSGMPMRDISELIPSTGDTLICNADYLLPEKIKWFKENDCKLIAISCIDSAHFSESIRLAPEAELIDRIFMVSGVQNTNVSNATVIDSDFNVTTDPRTFLPEEYWQRFDRMRRAGRLLSLPYVPWYRYHLPTPIPFPHKRHTVLFRGGHHFFRFIAYLFALRGGYADPQCGFQSRPYFADTMNPAFRYCDACRSAFKAGGDHYKVGLPRHPEQCQSAAPWGDKLDISVTGAWNNRCPESFYWLAEQFAKAHGEINMGLLETAMNHTDQSQAAHLGVIVGARFYADSKWEFSINMAQRFWEAAAVGTVNLIPRRARDQDYFPNMQDGEHFMTFADDFSDMTLDVDSDRYEHVAQQAKAHYDQWIAPTQYGISTHLLQHIFNQIESCNS